MHDARNDVMCHLNLSDSCATRA